MIAPPCDLPETLRERARRCPDTVAYRFVKDGELETATLTNAELDRLVVQLATWLMVRAKAGDRVLLVYPAGLEFIVAFFACLRARLIPVPVAVPNRDRNSGSLERVAADCTPALFLSVDAVRSRLPASVGHWQFSDCIALQSADEEPSIAVAPDDVALLQYTSGSTRNPRGVAVTHRSLSEQLEFYRLRAGEDWKEMAFVGWLPHHHDFGLIGFILSAMYMGAPYSFMAPAAFLQKPMRWIEAITRFRATYSGGPNFAYELCARFSHLPTREPVDLSGWKIASVGGEPVSATTLRRFVRAFEPRGFRREALLPAYGLAEAVLSVTARQGLVVRHFEASALCHNRVVPVPASSVGSLALVSCGETMAGQTVRIVDPQTKEALPQDRVGEIWVTGSGRAVGYWNQELETADTFRATVLGSGEESYLRTGDCGFLFNGELFATGRLKDLIITRGCNHSPEDIEWTIQEVHPAVRHGCGAVFQIAAPEHESLTDAAGEMPIVVVQEVDREDQPDEGELFAEMKRSVAESHGLRLDTIVLIHPKSLPRTTNGKICRHQCRSAFLEGRLRTVARTSSSAESPTRVGAKDLPRPDSESSSPDMFPGSGTQDPRDSIEFGEIKAVLLRHLRSLLPGVSIDHNDNFFSVGGDSLTAQRYLALIRETFEIELPVSALFDAPNVTSLARYVAQMRSSSTTPDQLTGSAVSTVSEAPPLTVQANDDGFANSVPATATVLSELRMMKELLVQQNRLMSEQNRLLEQQAELLRMLRGGGPPVTIVPDDLSFALTEAQREIKLLPELFPDAGAVFHSMMVLELSRPPIESIVRKALHALTARHETLRMAVDDAQQRILPFVEPDIRRVSLPEADEIVEWLRQERQRPYDLDRAPLWRVTVLSVSPDSHFLVFAAHHLIVDGWSLNLLADEFAACYKALCNGVEWRVPNVRQFREFCRDTTERQTAAALAPHQAYWHQLIGSQLPTLELPGDPPKSVASYAATTVSMEIGGPLRETLVRLGTHCSATLFQTMLSAYFAVLHRYTGQERIVIGIESSDRNDESGDLVGCCNTLLPIMVDIPDDPTAAELLQLVRNRVLGAMEHRDYTLAMLYRDLRTPLDTRLPFKVTATINLLRVSKNGECVSRCDLDAQSVTQSPFGLTLDIRDFGTSLRLDFICNATLFDKSTIERLAGWYRDLLVGMGSGAESRLFGQSILSGDEQQTILAWGAGGPGYRGAELYPQLFRAQVAATPDKLAVVCAREQLTFRELNDRANRLARLLNERGADSGSLVGLFCRRGGSYLVALLGILKAGCVYLPLDPKAPDQRLLRQIEQSGISIVVCGAEYSRTVTDLLHDVETCHLVIVDESVCEGNSEDPTVRRQLQDPAYALFTSGTTGEPKAALVSHRGMLNHLHVKIESLGLTSADVVAQTASVSFDISVWQFLAPLLVGATVCILDDEVTHDPSRLLGSVDDRGITIFQSVPVMIRAMIESEALKPSRQYGLRSLRWLLSIGEVLPPDLARKWISLYPRTPLLNEYGPAECSDTVTQHPVVWPPAGDARRVPIGRPIAGVRLYVLDRCRQLVPINTPGELYVGGDCVGLGYLNDPQRTTASFVPDPFSSSPEARLYRTGDLARFQRDGLVEFLGRRDRQLKMHGVRIEPAEIEAMLHEHPLVSQCVVTVKRSVHGDEMLVAYVALREKSMVTPGVLRALVRNKLPQAMVPSVVMLLDEIPTMTGGKVDLTSLPDPESDCRVAENAPPATPVQEQLVQIWSEVIRRERIGIHDDLFELGGRSLDAARIATKIGDAFNFRMPVSEVFRSPTVAGIASYVEKRRESSGDATRAFADRQLMT